MNPHRFAAIALALGMLAATSAQAQGVTVLDQRNTSSPDTRLDLSDGSITLFGTALAVSAPVTSGLTHTVDLRLSWLALTVSESPLPPILALTGSSVGWSLTLRVEDPLSQGYALTVGTRLRGLMAITSDGDTASGFSGVDPLLPVAQEAFAPSPDSLPGADIARQTQVVSPGDPAGQWRVSVNEAGQQRVGRYTGTRDFLFYLPDTPLLMGTYSTFDLDPIYAWQQFGRGTNDPALAFANPSQSDPRLEDLGYFFRASATFNAAPVPEPATWLLLAGGAGFMMLTRRRPA